MTNKDGDKVQSEMLAAVARYRAIDGERMFNHFLRNMLMQSNKVLRDHGLIVAEDQALADLEIQLRKARSEQATAGAYANHFAQVLKDLEGRKETPQGSIGRTIREALKWQPGMDAGVAEPAPIEPERATH